MSPNPPPPYQSYIVISYLINSIVCTDLDPAWNSLKTETTFPVNAGTELTVSCEDEFLQRGSDTVTCTEGTAYTNDKTPVCVSLGEFHYYDNNVPDPCNSSIMDRRI